MGCLALGAGVSVKALETRTIWFDIPRTTTYPDSVEPSPPDFLANAYPNDNGIWSTWSGTSLLNRGLPNTSAGLQVPTLGQLFVDLGIPAGLQGSLASMSIEVTTHARVQYNFTYTEGGNQTASANSSVTLTVLDLLTPPLPTFPGLFPTGTALVTHPLALNGSADIGPGGPGNNPTTASAIDTDSATTTVPLTSGQSFTRFSSTTPAYEPLPIRFETAGENVGTGNYSVAGISWGGVVIGLTYTWVPESDWAWAGLPVVIGGWMLRRRVVAARQQSATVA